MARVHELILANPAAEGGFAVRGVGVSAHHIWRQYHLGKASYHDLAVRFKLDVEDIEKIVKFVYGVVDGRKRPDGRGRDGRESDPKNPRS